jgi:2',3'-cyclic-nucleotide 2'-phosphodiesterase (5'-nucleotidase family)
MRFRFSSLVTISLLLLFSCARRPHVTETTLSHQYLANAKADSSVASALSSYKEKHDKEMNEVLVYCEEPLTKEQPEGNLGNFVSDCIYNKAVQYFSSEKVAVDAVLLNNGGLRVPLPQGEITRGKIFELMPFDNELVMIELSGKKFYEMLTFISEKGGMPVAGFRMEITAKKKPANVKIGGNALDTNATYHVITSDYLAEGGDNMTFFRDAPGKKYMKLLIRDVLIEYCRDLKKQNKTILVKTDGRISFSK